MRRFTVLLYRDETDDQDEYMGTVGSYGCNWRSAPEIFERLNVVDEATHERLVEALRNLEMWAPKDIDVAEDARALLAEIGEGE